MGFPGYFAAEILTGGFLPAAAAGWRWWPPARWRPGRCWRSRSPGIWPRPGSPGRPDGPLPPRAALAWAVRDLLLPLLWVVAWTGRGFAWRGNRMAVGAVPTRLGVD